MKANRPQRLGLPYPLHGTTENRLIWLPYHYPTKVTIIIRICQKSEEGVTYQNIVGVKVAMYDVS